MSWSATLFFFSQLSFLFWVDFLNLVVLSQFHTSPLALVTFPVGFFQRLNPKRLFLLFFSRWSIQEAELPAALFRPFFLCPAHAGAVRGLAALPSFFFCFDPLSGP